MTSRVPAIRKRAGNTRTTGKEQYYTPAHLAQTLTDELVRVVNATDAPFSSRTILEPAGGTGAFIAAASAAGATRFHSWDIEPLHHQVSEGDFLLQNLDHLSGCVTLGNPPFGRNNALSIPFFNHAAQVSDFIAFIVPRSWRKWSVINRLDRAFQLVLDHDIAIDYVDASGREISSKRRLNTCFQIWQRSQNPRPLFAVEDLGFISKTSPDDADVSLTVFGYGCGQLKTEFERKPNTTQMFLKVNQPGVIEALRKVDFSRFFRNTAYTEALSLSEINYLLNEELTGNAQLVEKS